jgi:hypothetical protein
MVRGQTLIEYAPRSCLAEEVEDMWKKLVAYLLD